MNKVFLIMVVFFFSCTVEDEESYFGCTDENALNFDSSAIENDNSCLYSEGCTDPTACNFNELAIEDDGSCNYPELLVYQSKNDLTPFFNGRLSEKKVFPDLENIMMQYSQVIPNNNFASKFFFNLVVASLTGPNSSIKKEFGSKFSLGIFIGMTYSPQEQDLVLNWMSIPSCLRRSCPSIKS